MLRVATPCPEDLTLATTGADAGPTALVKPSLRP